MKTSQLIQRLHETIQQYGDLDVYVTEFQFQPRRLFGLPSRKNGSAPDDVKIVQLHVVLWR
jgi:hypothetical protein